MALWLLPTLLLLGQQPDKAAPPLTKEQYEKVRELVHRTQEEAATLKAELEKCQRELLRRYSAFELDVAAVEKLQNEVLNLQRKTLTNYHRMQTELRTVVGKERFLILNQRIRHVIEPPLSKPPSPENRPH